MSAAQWRRAGAGLRLRSQLSPGRAAGVGVAGIWLLRGQWADPARPPLAGQETQLERGGWLRPLSPFLARIRTQCDFL